MYVEAGPCGRALAQFKDASASQLKKSEEFWKALIRAPVTKM